MERRNVAGGTAELGDERGRILVSSPARQVIVVRMTGHAPGGVMPEVVDALEALGGGSDPTDYFYDLWDMVTYDSKVRVDLTNFHLEHRPLLRSLHTCAQSRVVKMGVTVANVALRVIQQHADRGAFDAALDLRVGAPKRPMSA